MPDPTPQALGPTRVQLGLSQRQAAAILGVPLQTYCEWDHGRGRIPTDAAARLRATEPPPRPARGRPRVRGWVRVLLSPEAQAVWDAWPAGERSARASAALVRDMAADVRHNSEEV